MGIRETIQYWLGGVRLYVAAGIGLVTLQAWWWSQLVFGGNPDLATSRLHELYGWLSLVFLAVTLAIGPVYKLAPRLPGRLQMRDARRMLGIGAGWFAVLHTAIACFLSLKAVNPFELTATYSRSFLLGGLALLILAALTFTSFDAAMRRMGKWWFRLHRLVYVAAALAVLHAFSIGIHAVSLPALVAVIGTALVLFVLHVNLALQQTLRPGKWRIAALCLSFVVLIAASNYGLQQYININSEQGHSHQ